MKEPKTVQVTTYAEFLEVIAPLFEEVKGVGLGPLFRGQSDESWSLVPAFGRNRRVMDQEITPANEHERPPAVLEVQMFERFERQSTSLVPGTPNALELLSIAQHHGCPTRLLDWTTNASVGLWFAVSDKGNSDAAVWTLNPPRWGLMVSYKIAGLVGGIKDLDFFRFPHRSQRAIVQSSCYSFHPYRKACGPHWTVALDEDGPFREKLLKIVIPKDARRPILEALERAGTTAESTSLDLPGICKGLADMYQSYADSITLCSSPPNP